jgi:tetratricopeptide (TPR) repeat protein
MDEFQSSKDIEEKGFRHWERFELEEALKVFSLGLERYPEDRKIATGLAFTRLDLGDLPQARRLFEGLVATREDDDECWWGLGRIHLLLSNYGEARSCFERALAAAKADERVLLEVAREWYLLTFYEDALEYYQRALQANPKSAEALLGLGASEYWLGRPEAEGRLLEALRLDPLFHDCRSFLANLYFAQREHDKALAAFEKIPLNAHNDPVSIRRMLRMLRQRGVSESKLAPLKAELKRLNKEQGLDHFLSQVGRRSAGGRGPKEN